MEKDITGIFQNFRECARHIWNTYFRTLDDGAHKFINVERELYGTMVLEQIYGDSDYKADEGEYVKSFKVEPSDEIDCINVLLGNEIQKNYTKWDDILITVSKTELRFMEYFDWEDEGIRDYKYIRCRVVKCEDNMDIINKDILIDTDYVKICFMKSV
jgi:hypothetical protein